LNDARIYGYQYYVAGNYWTQGWVGNEWVRLTTPLSETSTNWLLSCANKPYVVLPLSTNLSLAITLRDLPTPHADVIPGSIRIEHDAGDVYITHKVTGDTRIYGYRYYAAENSWTQGWQELEWVRY
jgi:hypothetical protein